MRFLRGPSPPLIVKAMEQPLPTPAHQPTIVSGPTVTPSATPLERGNSLDDSAPRSHPGPLATHEANQKARRDHAISVKDLMERYGGCFTCRIEDPNHLPCHSTCGDSRVSGCSKRPHQIYTCTSLTHRNGWIDWKKRNFHWPAGDGTCYFCGLPSDVGGPHRSKKGTYPGMCRFSDSALAAAWHVVNTPHLLEDLQNDLGFTPGERDARVAFAKWVTEYGSEREHLRILTVFSWLCRRYYPSNGLA